MSNCEYARTPHDVPLPLLPASSKLTCTPIYQLESINDHLGEQTSDSTRFSRVLASKKHFDLVSEKEIQAAKAQLNAEIAPQLKHLIMRAEEALQRDERRSKMLKAKVRGALVDAQGWSIFAHNALSIFALRLLSRAFVWSSWPSCMTYLSIGLILGQRVIPN